MSKKDMTSPLPFNDESNLLSKDTTSFPVKDGNLLIPLLSEHQQDESKDIPFRKLLNKAGWPL
jgi:hypothetical protein